MKRHLDPIDGLAFERGYVYGFHFQLIWVTKYRRPLFTNDRLVNEMKSLLQIIADHNEIVIEQMDVQVDYVQLGISFKPKLTPTSVVKAFKGLGGRRFLAQHPEIKHDPFWNGHIWSNSYLMVTTGDLTDQMAQTYIQNQYQK